MFLIHFENTNFESEIYLGIRPEDISLENKSEIAVEIKIDLIENLGSEKIIYSHLNDTEIRIKSTKNIKDKKITIYFQKNKIYLFDNNKNRLKSLWVSRFYLKQGPRGGMVTQRIANPFIPVQFWAWPPE